MTLKEKLYRFLKWAEKYTKFDNIYVFKNLFFLNIESIVNIFLALFISYIIANYLDKEIYGNYKYVLTVLSMVGIFTLSEMNTAVTQSTAKGYATSLILGFKTKLKWGMLSTLCALIVAGYYWLTGNHTLVLPLIVGGILFPLQTAIEIYRAYLVGLKDFKSLVKFQIISQIINTLTLTLAILIIPNVFYIIVVYFLTMIIYQAPIFLKSVKNAKKATNQEIDSDCVSYGKKLTIVSAINNLIGNLDKILIYSLLGPIELALYQFASRIPGQLEDFMAKVNIISLPKLAEKNKQEVHQFLKTKILRLFFISTIISLTYIIFAPFIFTYLFPKYFDSLYYSQLLSLAIILFPFSIIYNAFEAQKLIKPITIINLSIPIFRVIVVFFFIYKFQVIGAIFAMILTQLFKDILVTYFYLKYIAKAD